MSRPRILLADDHRMIADAFSRMLSSQYEVVGIVEDGGALVESAARLKPDVALIDLPLPVLNWLEAARRVLADSPETKVVFLTMNHGRYLAATAFQLGASGFLLKSSDISELTDCLRTVLTGDAYLTRLVANGSIADLLRDAVETGDRDGLSGREREVLRLLVDGKAMKQAAHELGISPRTIQFHKYRVMARFELKSSAELIRFAMKNHLVPS
jgi:DNA-binding NarL/FixJ family response regulator